jgi:hypothetical protein
MNLATEGLAASVIGDEQLAKCRAAAAAARRRLIDVLED